MKPVIRWDRKLQGYLVWITSSLRYGPYKCIKDVQKFWPSFNTGVFGRRVK